MRVQGRASSSSKANSSSRASRPTSAGSIMPTGIPLADSASGSEIAGSPVTFCSHANAAQLTPRSMICCESAFGSR